MAEPNGTQASEKEIQSSLLLDAEVTQLVDEFQSDDYMPSRKSAAQKLIRIGYDKYYSDKRAVESINMAS